MAMLLPLNNIDSLGKTLFFSVIFGTSIAISNSSINISNEFSPGTSSFESLSAAQIQYLTQLKEIEGKSKTFVPPVAYFGVISKAFAPAKIPLTIPKLTSFDIDNPYLNEIPKLPVEMIESAPPQQIGVPEPPSNLRISVQ